MQRKRQPSILLPENLAEELGISLENALALMKQEDFPSTEIYPEHYVVDRSLLEKWIYMNHRNSGIDF